jgi:hypothetical protein
LEKSLRNSVDSGDFATYVERELSKGVNSPGAAGPCPSAMNDAADFVDDVHHRPGRRRAGWFLRILTAVVLGGMAYMALTQDRILLAQKQGETIYEGGAASVVGFVLIALAFFSLWQLAAGTRLSRTVGGAFTALWLLGLIWRLAGG